MKYLTRLSIPAKLALVAFGIICLVMGVMVWSVTRAATGILDEKAQAAMQTHLDMTKAMLAVVDRQARSDLDGLLERMPRHLEGLATLEGDVLQLQSGMTIELVLFKLTSLSGTIAGYY